MSKWTYLLIILLTVSCASKYPNQDVTGKVLPKVKANSLSGKEWHIPQDLNTKSILLIAYVQDAQFDIDRWLIAIDQVQIQSPYYELPTIQGMFPRMFKEKINTGMRKGIPKELWKGVITVYQGAEKIQIFTGNRNPNNARVLLVDKRGKVLFFHDRGFSVSALNKLKEKLN